MTANSRQMKLLRRTSPRHGEAAGYGCRLLLLLGLLLSGLVLPHRPLAATTTVVARQTDEALADPARPAVLPALLPAADVAAPQPRPELLPLLAAMLPAALQLPAAHAFGMVPAAPGQPAGPAQPGGATRLTSEVPNGP